MLRSIEIRNFHLYADQNEGGCLYDIEQAFNNRQQMGMAREPTPYPKVNLHRV